MVQLTEAKQQGDLCETGYRDHREYVVSSLMQERSKLESMVIERLRNSDKNLGTDLRILAQSNTVDQMVLHEMLLEEMNNSQSLDED